MTNQIAQNIGNLVKRFFPKNFPEFFKGLIELGQSGIHPNSIDIYLERDIVIREGITRQGPPTVISYLINYVARMPSGRSIYAAELIPIDVRDLGGLAEDVAKKTALKYAYDRETVLVDWGLGGWVDYEKSFPQG